MDSTVIEALRRFLPDLLASRPALSPAQRRAVWAIQHCRTATLGGQSFVCKDCGCVEFAYHSCNHKACPQCGAQAARDWVERELHKRVDAPSFLVTFTLPSELRSCFFGSHGKDMYNLFFAAASGALSEKLAASRDFPAIVHGFTAVLHTWNQRLMFHPHIHCLVPGAGLDSRGHLVLTPSANFLVPLQQLRGAFRQHMREQLKALKWQVDPAVWGMEWGVQIQPVGGGATAIKYLGAYVARTAISNSRILKVTDQEVTFRWRDRSEGNRLRTMTVPGMEFVARYLRHVLPTGLRSIRYYGFCHPAAKARRLRVKFLAGMVVNLGAEPVDEKRSPSVRCCSRCEGPMHLLGTLLPPWKGKARGPPMSSGSTGPQAIRTREVA